MAPAPPARPAKPAKTQILATAALYLSLPSVPLISPPLLYRFYRYTVVSIRSALLTISCQRCPSTVSKAPAPPCLAGVDGWAVPLHGLAMLMRRQPCNRCCSHPIDTLSTPYPYPINTLSTPMDGLPWIEPWIEPWIKHLGWRKGRP